MIYQALQILTDEVNVFFKEQNIEPDSDVVVLDNIAIAGSENESAAGMNNRVVLSLLTINEEMTLRNFPNRLSRSNKTVYMNEKVNLNLYVLFSGNKNEYKDSLFFISKIIEFFQGKKQFTQSNSSYSATEYPMNELEDFAFTMELYTPSFEDLNYIWGTLGGKQFPSALYKLSLVTLEYQMPVTESGIVEVVNTEMNEKKTE